MVYLADDLRPFLETEERHLITETDWATPKEIRKFLKLLREANQTVYWKMFAVENCVQTERGAKEFSKILKREIVPNNEIESIRLEEGDLIIYLELLPKGKSLHWIKVVNVI
jgi:hypothetical protein